MEGLPGLPLIWIALRTAEDEANFSTAIGKVIREKYETDPADYTNELTELNNSRRLACAYAKVDSATLKSMQKYFLQAGRLRGRFGNEIGMKFVWADAFSTNCASNEEIRFDEANVLWNIAALFSLFGAKEVRSGDESLKKAVANLQLAAGTFESVGQKYADFAKQSCEFDAELLQLLSTLMLAQAHEVIFEKSLRDARRPASCALLAAGISSQYKALAQRFDNDKKASGAVSLNSVFSTALTKTWRKLFELKRDFYEAVQFVQNGIHVEGNSQYGEAVAYFELAKNISQQCLDAVSRLSNASDSNLLEPTRFLLDVTTAKFDAAKRDNELAYHERVPSAAAIREREVRFMTLARCATVNWDDPELVQADPFARLVPAEIIAHASVYSDRLGALLRSAIAEADAANARLAEELKYRTIDPDKLRLDVLLSDAFDKECVEQPPSAEQQKDVGETLAESERVLGEEPSVGELFELASRLRSSEAETSVTQLCASMSDLASSVVDVQDLLETLRSAIECELNDESLADESDRQLVTKCKSELSELENAVTVANRNNEELQTRVRVDLDGIRHLKQFNSRLSLNSSLPNPFRRVAPLLRADTQVRAQLAELARLLAKLEEMKTQRNSLIERLRAETLADSAVETLLARAHEQVEGVFADLIRKHDTTLALLQANITAQPNIVRALDEAAARCAQFVAAFYSAVDERRERIRALSLSGGKLQLLVAKVHEGVVFFKQCEQLLVGLQQKLAEPLARARQRRHLAAKRRVEPPKPSLPPIPAQAPSAAPGERLTLEQARFMLEAASASANAESNSNPKAPVYATNPDGNQNAVAPSAPDEFAHAFAAAMAFGPAAGGKMTLKDVMAARKSARAASATQAPNSASMSAQASSATAFYPPQSSQNTVSAPQNGMQNGPSQYSQSSATSASDPQQGHAAFPNLPMTGQQSSSAQAYNQLPPRSTSQSPYNSVTHSTAQAQFTSQHAPQVSFAGHGQQMQYSSQSALNNAQYAAQSQAPANQGQFTQQIASSTQPPFSSAQSQTTVMQPQFAPQASHTQTQYPAHLQSTSVPQAQFAQQIPPTQAPFAAQSQSTPPSSHEQNLLAGYSQGRTVQDSTNQLSYPAQAQASAQALPQFAQQVAANQPQFPSQSMSVANQPQFTSLAPATQTQHTYAPAQPSATQVPFSAQAQHAPFQSSHVPFSASQPSGQVQLPSQTASMQTSYLPQHSAASQNPYPTQSQATAVQAHFPPPASVPQLPQAAQGQFAAPQLQAASAQAPFPSTQAPSQTPFPAQSQATAVQSQYPPHASFQQFPQTALQGQFASQPQPAATAFPSTQTNTSQLQYPMQLNNVPNALQQPSASQNTVPGPQTQLKSVAAPPQGSPFTQFPASASQATTSHSLATQGYPYAQPPTSFAYNPNSQLSQTNGTIYQQSASQTQPKSTDYQQWLANNGQQNHVHPAAAYNPQATYAQPQPNAPYMQPQPQNAPNWQNTQTAPNPYAQSNAQKALVTDIDSLLSVDLSSLAPPLCPAPLMPQSTERMQVQAFETPSSCYTASAVEPPSGHDSSSQLDILSGSPRTVHMPESVPSREIQTAETTVVSKTSETKDVELKPHLVTADELVLSKKEEQLKTVLRSSSVTEWLADNLRVNKFVCELEKFARLVQVRFVAENRLSAIWNELSEAESSWLRSESASGSSRSALSTIGKCYASKNRDNDLLPFDANRVALKDARDDYVNASSVDGLGETCASAVVTQWPLANTLADFWLLAFELGSEVIVCLANGKREQLAPNYWPVNKNEPVRAGTIEVTLQVAKENEAGWTERIFTVRNLKTGALRSVVHLECLLFDSQLPTAQLASSPSSPYESFVRFVTESHAFYAQQRSLVRPILVHCSNGCGRTGLFLLTYAAIRHVQANGALPDLAAILKQLRTQRRGLLETKEQLAFAYECVLHFSAQLLERKGIQVSLPRSTMRPAVAQQPLDPVTPSSLASASQKNVSPVANSCASPTSQSRSHSRHPSIGALQKRTGGPQAVAPAPSASSALDLLFSDKPLSVLDLKAVVVDKMTSRLTSDSAQSQTMSVADPASAPQLPSDDIAANDSSANADDCSAQVSSVATPLEQHSNGKPSSARSHKLVLPESLKDLDDPSKFQLTVIPPEKRRITKFAFTQPKARPVDASDPFSLLDPLVSSDNNTRPEVCNATQHS